MLAGAQGAWSRGGGTPPRWRVGRVLPREEGDEGGRLAEARGHAEGGRLTGAVTRSFSSPGHMLGRREVVPPELVMRGLCSPSATPPSSRSLIAPPPTSTTYAPSPSPRVRARQHHLGRLRNPKARQRQVRATGAGAPDEDLQRPVPATASTARREEVVVHTKGRA